MIVYNEISRVLALNGARGRKKGKGETMTGLRRSMLFVPGNKPEMLPKAVVSGADSIILDLEDSVGMAGKEEARLLVRQALGGQEFPAATKIVVRINPLSAGNLGYDDLDMIARMKPDALLLPKASENDVKKAADLLDKIENEESIEKGAIKIFPLIETAQGLINISRIVGASSRVAGVLFGAEDYTADLGIKRTVDGEELLYARSKIAVTCRAFGIEAIDTPFVDLQDTEGLIRDTGKARALGMTGKAAIHPRQVKVIHEVLNPSPEEIRHAQIIARAMEQAEKEGKAVISLDDKMIDAPVAARAKKILLMAELAGLYEE